MCGLVGVAGEINYREKKIFKHLHLLDVLRGEDSSGIFWVNSKEETKSIKSIGLPDALPWYDQNNEFNKDGLISDLNCKIISGHNRAATKGNITDSNAHPFDCDSVIGMHNGTLYDHTFRDFKVKCETDSETLFWEISDKGIKNVYGRVGGALALVWFNKKEKSLNFLRNTERPLFFTASKDGKTLFWASEPWMLRVAITRVVKTSFEKEYTEVESFEPHKHYKIFPLVESGKKLKMAPVVTLAPRVTHFHGANAGYGYGYGSWRPPETRKGVTLPQPQRVGEGMVKIDDRVITLEAAQRRLDHSKGCCICSETPDVKDAEAMEACVWLDYSTFVCGECVEQEGKDSFLFYMQKGL